MPAERKFIFPENNYPNSQFIADRNGIPDNIKSENANDSYKILSGSQPTRGKRGKNLFKQWRLSAFDW